MDDDLERELMERLLGEGTSPPEDVANLVYAACQGAQALAEQLATPVTNRPAVSVTQRAALPASALGGTFLESLEVVGFRGVGPAVSLGLSPGPGLTLVVGRNGCAKSSLAEALEALFTAQSARFEGRPKEWATAWRNLHVDEKPRVSATFTTAGHGRLQATRSWAPEGGLADGVLRVTDAQGRVLSADELGWTTSVAEFRPFLSYAELGKIGQEPSKVFDALNVVLGLDAVGEAQARLAAALSPLTSRAKSVKDARAQLTSKLQRLDDPRAKELLGLLTARKPDLDALADTLEAQRSEGGEGDVRVLTQLSRLDTAVVDWAALAATWREALAKKAEVADESSARQASLATLLRDTLAFITDETTSCPVCERPTDGTLRERLTTRAQEATALAGAYKGASAAVDAATRAIQNARAQLPTTALGAASGCLTDEQLAPTREAVDALRTATTPDALELAHLRYAEAVPALTVTARAALEGLDADYRELSRGLGRWLEDARAVADEQDDAKRLKAAREWLKGAETELRDARFAPIEQQVLTLWKSLGAQSDVSLDKLRLVGSGTQRKLALDARVGDKEAAALAVMSQGELSALALALFLPRTALAQSPFRFVVIDDPVQAMDPIRVDGLAKILGDAAETRQVIVLTHDERLPEAVRRMQIPARVLRVDRRGESHVALREQQVAWQAYTDDAWAVARSNMGAELVRRVVPTFCRHALEAAAIMAYRRERLRAGDHPTEVAESVRDAHTLMEVLSLGLFGTADRTGEVFRAVNNRVGRDVGDCVRACKQGAHEPVDDYRALIDNTRQVAAWIAER
ncbi:MAG: hypothetical protein R3B40_22430 [Polyangiales bacterium]|nr:hypothetical protein [Myxococcales bacterium]